MNTQSNGVRPHSFPVRLVQCQLETDHYAGVDRALAERGIASERVFPDEPPPRMGERTRAVVISDPFASMNGLAFRQARRVGARVVMVMDGIVEYRNTFVNPRVGGVLARGDVAAHKFLRPALADVVACCGEIDRRVLSALGNEAVATGLPRLAGKSGVAESKGRRAVMIATANQPWFTEEERGRVIDSLRALKWTLERMGVEAVWRVRGELDAELGVASDRRALREVLGDVSAVVTTPSTLMVESMLAGRATAVLRAHATPLWQPAAWGWRGAGVTTDEPEMSAARDLDKSVRQALRGVHDEAAAMTAWYGDAGALIESMLAREPGMMERQRECLGLLCAGATGRRSPAENFAGLLQTICVGDLPRAGGARAAAFPSPVRIPDRRPAGKRPCVVSCVVCDDSPVGGVQSWSVRLGEAFASRNLGYDVRTLMVCVKPDAWRTSGASVTPSERMDLCVIDPMADHTESLAQVRAAIENVAGGVPAIVIPNYTDITYAAAMQLRAQGTRTIAVAHTDEAYYQELASTYCLWDGGVGVSRRCVEWMGEIERATRRAGSGARPVEWIPCVAPVAASPRAVEAEGRIKLAYVGRMVQVQKRIADLLILVDELESRGVAYELHMVGDGVDLPGWRASLARRKLRTGRVIVHGRREAAWVAQFMRGIDASVLVSEFEGTSVSMLEAMGAGVVPCVTEVRSGVAEWVTEGETGVVVPIGAMGEMAERIARLSRDRGELKRLGRAAWEKARRDASMEGMAAKYRALFDAVRARVVDKGPTDLGLRLLERWRWNKDWAEEPLRAMDRVRVVLAEAGFQRIVNDAPVPGCDAVIVRTDARPMSRVQAEQIELWRSCGLGVVTMPHLRGRVADDAMSPVEAQACDRVRGLAAGAAAEGCKRIAVYGTGKHTRRLAAIFDGSLPFVGFIDDAPPAWEYMFGLPIVGFDAALEELRPDAVVLSSDAWEGKMWARTEAYRRAGVRVIAVYGDYGAVEPKAAVASIQAGEVRAATPIARMHAERIERARAAGLEVGVVACDAAEESVERVITSLGARGVVFIHGAEQARFDGMKSRLVELGHMGACAEAPGAHLWWGAARGWAVHEPRAGELPVIVSYYTMNTAYEEEARGLVKTCDALGLEHRVVGVPARGTWEGNCAMKAGFVLEMWESLRRPVLWVDADARMRRVPELFRGMTADFGIHKAARWQFSSGTVFINATELGGELLRVWKRRCEEDSRVWDQVHLDRAWEEVATRAPLETAWLPQAYTRIFDKPEEADGGGSVVVEHFQASRRLKEAVTQGPVSRFVDFDEATKAARRASRPCAA